MNRNLLWLGTVLLMAAGPAYAGGFLSLQEDGIEWPAWCHYAYVNGTESLQLGVFEPVNPAFGPLDEVRAVTNIAGFQCRLEPGDGVYIFGVDYPVAAYNADTGNSLTITFAEPVPVSTSGLKTALATVHVFFGTPAGFVPPDEVFSPCYLNYNTGVAVRPAAAAWAPGSVAIIDADDPVDPIVPVNNSPEDDMYFTLLQDPSVPVAAGTWGAVKALYR